MSKYNIILYKILKVKRSLNVNCALLLITALSNKHTNSLKWIVITTEFVDRILNIEKVSLLAASINGNNTQECFNRMAIDLCKEDDNLLMMSIHLF